MLLTASQAQILLRGSLFWEISAGTVKPGEHDCPASAYAWMGRVYAAASKGQGVVSDWGWTAIIWAQRWRVMGRDREGGGRPVGVVFPQTLVKFCSCVHEQLPWTSQCQWCISSFVYASIMICLCIFVSISAWACLCLYTLTVWSVRVNRCV